MLATRLRNRSRAEGLVDAQVIARRLEKARHEIENFADYGYILVNDVLDAAVEQLLAIVKVERCCLSREPIIGDDAERLQALANAARWPQAYETLNPVLESFGVAPVQAAKAGR